MNALTTDRIRSHATRLGLTHLTETITALVERAETAQLGKGREMPAKPANRAPAADQ